MRLMLMTILMFGTKAANAATVTIDFAGVVSDDGAISFPYLQDGFDLTTPAAQGGLLGKDRSSTPAYIDSTYIGRVFNGFILRRSRCQSDFGQQRRS